MFDIGASELLVIVIVAILVIGPKDMPLALRTAGRWIGKIRRMSAHFRSGIDSMIREAEMEENEKKWRERNARIMAEHPDGADGKEPANLLPPEMEPLEGSDSQSTNQSSAEAAMNRSSAGKGRSRNSEADDEPGLPLDQPGTRRQDR